ncbi:hypothetical protein AAH074_17560, partial [Parabacteroides merdae]|uniref:hypothetical protein n=1 Tax=Parabacteroides merdae TaxID=46503 RepID=UPI0039B4F171
DPVTRAFGAQVDTLYNAKSGGMSASLRMKEIALISVSCLQTMDLICMSEADLLFGTKDILASKI